MNTSNKFATMMIIAWCSLVLVLSGCTPSTKSGTGAKAVAGGKWRVNNSKETMEFSSDGTCRGSDSYGRVVTGKFTFIDSDHMKVETTTTSTSGSVAVVDKSSGVYKVVVQGDSLTMTEGNGQAIHYQRTQ